MIVPDIDEAHLEAVFAEASAYYLDRHDLEALEEFLSASPWQREHIALQNRETLLRIQLSTFALFQSRQRKDE